MAFYRQLLAFIGDHIPEVNKETVKFNREDFTVTILDDEKSNNGADMLKKLLGGFFDQDD